MPTEESLKRYKRAYGARPKHRQQAGAVDVLHGRLVSNLREDFPWFTEEQQQEVIDTLVEAIHGT